ncbi:MAG: hypothetical protein KDB27_10450 [Planctomycetales bacterium]|nr:hypothetical protein [Planctomycetales bacterium]
MSSIRPQIVRDLVRRVLTDHLHRVPDLSESFLIRNGHYCGYRFSYEQISAIWFAEEAEVKFYDESGAIIQVVDLSEGESLKQAA